MNDKPPLILCERSSKLLRHVVYMHLKYVMSETKKKFNGCIDVFDETESLLDALKLFGIETTEGDAK